MNGGLPGDGDMAILGIFSGVMAIFEKFSGDMAISDIRGDMAILVFFRRYGDIGQ